jgi:transposase-like protein
MATQEEKIQAVAALRNRGKKTVDKIAKAWGVSTPTLYQWQKALAAAAERAEPAAAPNGHGNDERPALPLIREIKKNLETVDASEVARLRAENAELRSLLKKLL